MLRDRDGDALIAKIQDALENGEPINELYLRSLMRSRLTVGALLRKAIELEKKLPDEVKRNKISELTLVLSNRIVDNGA